MSSYEQTQQEEQHTFAIVPTRVINERTYVCDLLEPHELPTEGTNLQQTCTNYVCCNDANNYNGNDGAAVNNNFNTCVYTSYDNTSAYRDNSNNNNNNTKYYTSVSNYTNNTSNNRSEKILFSVEPHLLLFPPPHHGRCIQNVLMLHNSSVKEMCVYKLKCEKPHAFVAKHNVGLMYANSSLELRVTLRAVDKENDFKDNKDKEHRSDDADKDKDDITNANGDSISYKEINERSIVHFRLEIKFFKKLPERFAKHLHFKKEHTDKDDSSGSDDDDDREEEEKEEEEDDIENNKILNERINAREVWNYFAEVDEHSNDQEHHHQHFNEHYHEEEQEEDLEQREERHRHRSSGITQCEVIDLKAYFDAETRRPETSTIIELPADYPNGLHSYTRSEHGHSKHEKNTNETDNKPKSASNEKAGKESTEHNLMPPEHDNDNAKQNQDDQANNTNTEKNDMKKNTIDSNDIDAPRSMLSASPTNRTKLNEADKNEQQQQQAGQNPASAPSSLTNQPTNKTDNNTYAHKDDNISFDSKALPRSFEEPKDKTATSAPSAKTEAAASTPASANAKADANANPGNMETATESLFELYPNDDKPTNRAEPTDAFNDTTDALTSDKKASERAHALRDQQKHISFANYSNTLLQSPLSIDNLAASIRASTIYNKSVVLTNKMRPYANMLLICIGFICVLALLLPPPQEKQQQQQEQQTK